MAELAKELGYCGLRAASVLLGVRASSVMWKRLPSELTSRCAGAFAQPLLSLQMATICTAGEGSDGI